MMNDDSEPVPFPNEEGFDLPLRSFQFSEFAHVSIKQDYRGVGDTGKRQTRQYNMIACILH